MGSDVEKSSRLKPLQVWSLKKLFALIGTGQCRNTIEICFLMHILSQMTRTYGLGACGVCPRIYIPKTIGSSINA